MLSLPPSGVNATFDPLLRTAIHDLGRLKDISAVLARHGFAQFAEIVRTGKKEDTKLAEHELAGAPKRFTRLLQDLGPTYVKFGQVLSTRPDIMPLAYLEELKTLQDRVPPLEYAVISKAIEEEFEKPVGEIFQKIDETPLASASISQVHRATLPDGRAVVVKVQRPGIEKTIRSDLDLLYVLARLLDATIEESGLYRPVDIVKEFEKAIFEELDFMHEARNVRELRQNFANHESLRFPEIVDLLTTPTVMVMEFIDGVKISEITPETHDVEKVVNALLTGYFQMVFEDGFFHGDPHPGNILVLKDSTVALLDCGLVGRLTRSMQDLISQLSLAIAMRDAESTARICFRMGTPMERVNLIQFRDEVQNMLDRYVSGKLGEMSTGSLLREMLDMSLRHKVKIPPEVAILAKAGVTLEGVVRGLDPDLDIVETVTPYARRLMMTHFGFGALRRIATKGALGLVSTMQDMPLQVHQIMSDLESGRLSVRVTHDELNKLSKSLNDLGSKMFLGLLTCGLILGGSFLIARHNIDVKGVPLVPILMLSAAGLIVTFVFWWHVLYGRWKKIRLGFWLGLFKKRKGE